MSDVIRIMIAPLVWLASFSAVYGLHGLMCGHGLVAEMPPALPRTILAGAYGLALAAQVAILFALYRSPFAAGPGFVRRVSIATGWTGLVAAAWSLMPVLTTSVCR